MANGGVFATAGTSKTCVGGNGIRLGLTAGDTVYYNSVVPHFIGAVDGPAEIYAVLYVPM